MFEVYHRALRTVFAWQLGLLLVMFAPQSAAAEGTGPGRSLALIEGQELVVYTYRPSGCSKPSILIVFHGSGRTAESYRDASQPLADKLCLSIYAPLFDDVRFPNWSYQRGGIVHEGRVQPRGTWTVSLVDDLIDWTQEKEGSLETPAYLYGHSAGGQFLSRLAAYELPTEAQRIVIANPSTYVWPDLAEDAPYGFDNWANNEEEAKMLQAYLAAPVTIFLGSEDTGDKDLTMSAPAKRQGDNRLERGKNVFAAAQKQALKRGWTFNWLLIQADGIGHEGGEMMRSEEMPTALGLDAAR